MSSKVVSHPVSGRQVGDELIDAILIPPQTWQDPDYNAFHFAKIGILLGLLGGCTSLVLNVIGSVVWPAVSGVEQHPLRLIQIYLTFPLGESAMTLTSGVLPALGCILYLATGMLYGMVFVLTMSYLVPKAGVRTRLAVCSVLALLVWTINFYLLLDWLQPLLLGGRWIVELIPWWVGAATHLVFGWTIAVLFQVDTSSSSKTATGGAS